MARKTYFPHFTILVPNRKSCACLRAQSPLQKIPRPSNHLPAAEQRPRHRRCPTSRDFVPWRFSDAGRHSSWIASSCRHPKTCTKTEVAPLERQVRSTLKSRHRQDTPACPKSADSVAKVVNRTTAKISRKLIFRLFYRCNAL